MRILSLFYLFWVVALVAVAQDLPLLLEDDFDPARDESLWLDVLGSSRGPVQGGNGTEYLRFSGVGTRWANLRPVDVSGGGYVTFSLRAGNAAADGAALWDDSAPGSKLYLMVSRDGVQWAALEMIDIAYPAHSSWTEHVVKIPKAFWYSNLHIQWSGGLGTQAAENDVWGLDNVRVYGAHDGELKVLGFADMRSLSGEYLRLSVNPNHPSTFQWFKDGLPLPGATLIGLQRQSLTPADAGRYHCEVTHGQTMVSTPPRMVVVMEKVGSGRAPVTAGGGFVLQAAVHPAEVVGQTTFEWRKDGAESLAEVGQVSGGDTAVLTVSSATSEAAGRYYCRMTWEGNYRDVGPYVVGLEEAPVLSDGSSIGGLSSDSLYVTWTKPAGATGYNLQYRQKGEAAWTAYTPALSGIHIAAVLRNLHPDTEYEIRIQALSSASFSPWSQVLTLRTIAQPAPTVSYNSVQQVELTVEIKFWSDFADSVVVEKAAAAEGPWSVLATVPLTGKQYEYASYVDPTLRVGTWYYRLQARRGELVSAYTAVRSWTLLDPQLTVTTSRYDDVIEVSAFNSALGFKARLQRREWRLTGEEDAWVDLATLVGRHLGYSDSHVVTGPAPVYGYQYRLVPVPEDRGGTVSEIASQTTYYRRPSAPQEFKVSDVSETRISLKWLDGGGELGYWVERRSGSESRWARLATLETGATSYVDETVEAGQAYWYRVLPYNGLGVGGEAVSPMVEARDTVVLVEEDFEQPLDRQVWKTVKAVVLEPEDPEQAGGDHVLRAQNPNSSTVELRTKPLDVRHGGYVDVSYKAPVWSDYTYHYFSVEWWLEFCFKAGTYGAGYVTTFERGLPTESAWQELSFPIAAAARTDSTEFYLLQYRLGAIKEPWAVDNIKIRAIQAPVLQLTTLPVPTVKPVGSTVSFTVVADQAGAMYQWSKDGVDIPGATASVYALPAATLDDVGMYLCTVSYQGRTLLTEAVPLVLVQPAPVEPQRVPLGGKVTLLMQVAAPEGLLSEIRVGWQPPSFPYLRFPTDILGTVVGERTNELTISQVTAEASGTFFGSVNYYTGGRSYGLSLNYKVEVMPPPVIAPVADQTVVAGQGVEVPVNVEGENVTVTVSGLPKGLTYDAETRRITGSAAVALAGRSYAVTVQATNEAGEAEPVSFDLVVVPFPVALAGTYRGVLTETGSVFLHGGQVTVQISTKGAVSGTVMLRGKTLRFTQKQAEAAVDGAWIRVEAAFKGVEKEALLVRLEMTAGAETHAVELWPAGGGGATAAGGGGGALTGPVPLASGEVVRNDWSVKNAAPGAGTLNALVTAEYLTVLSAPEITGELTLAGEASEPAGTASALVSAGAASVAQAVPEEVRLHPAGQGFLNLTLKTNGTVTVKGRLADGQVLTGATVMGPGGHMPVFMNLYRGTGSFAVLLNYEEERLSGLARWGKDDQGQKSRDRVFRGGFARHDRLVRGGRYVRPAVGEPLPGLGGGGEVTEESAAGAELAFSSGGLVEPLALADVAFTARHAPVLPRGAELNPHSVTLKLNAVTGVFTGSFKLVDANPVRPTQRLTRTVAYHGAVIPGEDGGHGFFLLPELPDAEVKGSSLGNTPQWSGQVRLE